MLCTKISGIVYTGTKLN